jgi:hypothetical protein
MEAYRAMDHNKLSFKKLMTLESDTGSLVFHRISDLFNDKISGQAGNLSKFLFLTE